MKSPLSFFSDSDAVLAAISKSQAVIEFKPDGTIITANENFCKTLGYSLDEIKGRHHSLFIEPAFRESDDYKAFWNNLNRGIFQAAEYKRIGKGGKQVWIEASYNPILTRSGKVVKIVKFATDITGKKLQSAVMQGKLDAIDKSQAVIEFNLDGTIITANENFLNCLGYRQDEIVGKHHSMFVEAAFRTSNDYKKFWDDLNRGVFQSARYKRIGKGGKEIYIQASYNPILDMNGKPFQVVKFATDVTAEVQEQQRRQGVQKEIDVELKSIMSQIADASAQASSAASASIQASSNVQAVAAGAEEMTASVDEISRQVQQASEIANSAVNQADDTNVVISSLSEAVQRIGQVVELINNVASQTNLLALNATIEAARAGEAGKGFAVVASEVKNLAGQTTKATDEIRGQINEVQAATQRAVTAIGEITATISSISQISTAIASAVEEQAQ